MVLQYMHNCPIPDCWLANCAPILVCADASHILHRTSSFQEVSRYEDGWWVSFDKYGKKQPKSLCLRRPKIRDTRVAIPLLESIDGIGACALVKLEGGETTKEF